MNNMLAYKECGQCVKYGVHVVIDVLINVMQTINLKKNFKIIISQIYVFFAWI